MYVYLYMTFDLKMVIYNLVRKIATFCCADMILVLFQMTFFLRNTKNLGKNQPDFFIIPKLRQNFESKKFCRQNPTRKNIFVYGNGNIHQNLRRNQKGRIFVYRSVKISIFLVYCTLSFRGNIHIHCIFVCDLKTRVIYIYY